MPLFAYICTKTTADFVVPVSAASQQDFNRRVVNAFKGNVGGAYKVGKIEFYTVEKAIHNHLICDGSTITALQFPELVPFLAGAGATQATLPNLSGALTVAAPTVVQTVSTSGTVDAGGTVAPAGTVGGTAGGNVPSGGRLRDPPGGAILPP